MHRRILGILAVGLFSLAAVTAQELDLKGALALAEGYDAATVQAETAYQSAVLGRRSVEAALLPQVNLSADPGYSLLHGVDLTVVPPEASSTVEKSLDLGVDVSQALPTDGLLSLSLSNSSTVTVTGEESDVSQAPRATLGLAQPVWVNGRPLDLRLFGARRRVTGELPVLRAAESRRQARNQAAIALVTTYKQVYSLRRQIAQTDVNIYLTEKSLEQMRVREDQGSVTPTDVWELEIDLDGLHESRMELGYQLLQAEATLAASVGLDSVATRTLLADVPSLDGALEPHPENADQADISSVAAIRSARWDLEEARLNRVLSGRDSGGSLTASVTLSPAYDPTDIDYGSRDWSTSISDLTAEGANVNLVVSLGLTLPLFDGGQAKAKASIAAIAEADASARLASTEKAARNDLDALLLRRSMIKDRIDYLEGSLEFSRKRLAESETRFGLQQITAQDLERARLRVSEGERNLWESRMDYFVNGLQLLDWRGFDLFDLLVGGGDQ